MEIKTNWNSTNKRNEFAFSAIMFFAPLIKNNIKINKHLSDEDKSFINGYIKLWYFNIILLIICIIIWIIHFRTNDPIFEKINIWLLITLSISLIIWTLLVAINKNINKNNDLEALESKNDFEKLLYFIPIYNIYIRYNNHQFEWENSTIKCSIILRSIFALSAVFIMNIYLNIFILCIIVIIALCNINWIYFGSKLKQSLNNSFSKNPEEIRWYITGPLYAPFNKKGIKNSIEEQKKHYEFLFKTDNKQIIVEYILLTILCLIGIYYGTTHWKYIIIIWDIFIILRYFIMLIKRQHLPHLPIFRWITNIFFKSNKTKNE